MVKRTNREIRKSIFNILKDNKAHFYGDLERKVNTNWKTIRDHIEYMELFYAIKINDGKIKITDFGFKVLRRLSR